MKKEVITERFATIKKDGKAMVGKQYAGHEAYVEVLKKHKMVKKDQKYMKRLVDRTNIFGTPD